MMPEPWEDRLVLASPSPHAAIARALARDGRRVVSMREGGRAGKTMTATYTYDCGCKRTYKATQLTAEEAEFLTPCGVHHDLTNLLTEGAEQATIERTLEG